MRRWSPGLVLIMLVTYTGMWLGILNVFWMPTLQRTVTQELEALEIEQKTIVHLGERNLMMLDNMKFKHCLHFKCVFYQSKDKAYASVADVVILSRDSQDLYLHINKSIRKKPLWIMHSLESPKFFFNKWNPHINNFNGTITYLRDSLPVSLPYAIKASKPTNYSLKTYNYAKGKTKGAFAYISTCNSFGYDRLETMLELANYIEVDIFGQCAGEAPCPIKNDLHCEAREHSKYKFFFSFESSLCKDYITQSFWRTLASPANYIPIAIGGLSMYDYTRIAPPDSFIHAYNFTSIAQLGQYLQYLMEDDAAYNRYHRWKSYYNVLLETSSDLACELCKAAHHPETLKINERRKFADEWNDPNHCRVFTP